MADMTRAAYRIVDLVEATGLSRAALYQDMASGLLRFVKRGRSRLVLADDLTAYLSSFRPPSTDHGPHAPVRHGCAPAELEFTASGPLTIHAKVVVDGRPIADARSIVIRFEPFEFATITVAYSDDTEATYEVHDATIAVSAAPLCPTGEHGPVAS